ncbi:MAG: ankyrin repeat domain-containing protein [Deltaproteobacteria bacterium]|nr:ankyrin repeat domain-containing protein [Deltaproteobacteria bacterium]
MSEDLLLYAQLGYAEHIQRLVHEGADPDWRREDGVTTLMIASLTGRVEIMNALLDAGASIDLQAPDGMTALLAATAYARTTRDIAGVELLLARGADPKLANAEGNDPLMMSARHGLVEATIALLKAGADPKRANRYGTTALMQAARGHLVETVKVLIRAGADPTQRDERGLTAIKYANELGAPPNELALALEPSGLGSVPSLTRDVCRFDRPDFKLKLIGSWAEQGEEDSDVLEIIETTGERQIFVSVIHLPVELDADERHDAISRRVKEHMQALRDEVESEVRFSEVRFAEASDAIQARFNGTGANNDAFFAVCVYAAPLKFVTLTYKDFRPQLTEEARGRQAGESVAAFRVK